MSNRGIMPFMNFIKIFVSLFLGVYFLGCDTKSKPSAASCTVAVETDKRLSSEELKTELKELQRVVKETGTPMCCQKYIENVIREGSKVLNLPAGVMDAGFAHGEDVKKIASYVLTLSGRKPVYPHYLQEGNMLYNGNCGGCHGDDGKGLNGAYPDLTQPLFQGAKLRKEHYINKIKELETELAKGEHDQ